VLLGLCSILRKHNTSWASDIERFQVEKANKSEASKTKFRKLLDTRAIILKHEKELDEKEARLEEERQNNANLQLSVEETEKELLFFSQGSVKHEKLVTTKRETLQKREAAVRIRQNALTKRKEALNKLMESAGKLETSLEESKLLQQQALDMREDSVQAVCEALDIEETVIESERLALKQEKEILERKLIGDTPTSESSPIDDARENSSIDAVNAAIADASKAEDDDSEEEQHQVDPDTSQPLDTGKGPQPMKKLEQAAVAIGGE